MSCQRPIGRRPGSRSRCRYCMLPASQRSSRRRNSGRAGGFASHEPSSSGSTRTPQPAPRSTAASTWSCDRMCRPSGSDRQPAVRAERRDADDRVVAPVRALVALPPGLPGRPGAHPGAHAELEQPREGGRRRQPDRQMLHDRQRRIRLHGAHQAQHRRRRHLGVGIERQHQFEPLGVVVEELHHVAGLEAGVRGAPTIMNARRLAVLGAEGRHRLFFGGRRRPVPGIGQDEQGEDVTVPRQVQLVQQPPQRRQNAPHVLLRTVTAIAVRGNGGTSVAASATGNTACTGSRHDQQDNEADQSVGQAKPGPRRGAGKRRQHHQFGQRPAAGRQHLDQKQCPARWRPAAR